MARDAARIDHVQPLQVAHDLRDDRLVDYHALAAMLDGVRSAFVAHKFQQCVRVGQARRESHRQWFQFGGELHLRPDQHQHMRLAAIAALQDVAHLPLRTGVAKVGMEIQ